MASFDDQSLLILDQSNNIILKNKSFGKNLNLEGIVSETKPSFSIRVNNRSFEVQQLLSTKYGWKFISSTPTLTLYQLPIRLSQPHYAAGALPFFRRGGAAERLFYT